MISRAYSTFWKKGRHEKYVKVAENKINVLLDFCGFFVNLLARQLVPNPCCLLVA